MFKFSLPLSFSCLLALAACQNNPPPGVATDGVKASTPASLMAVSLPPLKRQFACMPDEAYFIAAHRGYSQGVGLAENSASGLKALIEKGYQVAEIDIARSQDGTHFLYHDGVWDEKSTGRGPISQSLWADTQTLLLKDETGAVTADRPVSFKDVLAMSKDKLYLEIDFKSSSNEAEVVKEIQAAGMADDVILIAYSKEQAKRLAALTPDMMISVSVKQMSDVADYIGMGISKPRIAAWLGRARGAEALTAELRRNGVTVLAMERYEGLPEGAQLVVSDRAFDYKGHTNHKGILGLTSESAASYQKCLEGNASAN
ncbi:MAG: glycerophosphodiester phosphodiesterase family protein [Maricaulaceae bacterium]